MEAAPPPTSAGLPADVAATALGASAKARRRGAMAAGSADLAGSDMAMAASAAALSAFSELTSEAHDERLAMLVTKGLDAEEHWQRERRRYQDQITELEDEIDSHKSAAVQAQIAFEETLEQRLQLHIERQKTDIVLIQNKAVEVLRKREREMASERQAALLEARREADAAAERAEQLDEGRRQDLADNKAVIHGLLDRLEVCRAEREDSRQRAAGKAAQKWRAETWRSRARTAEASLAAAAAERDRLAALVASADERQETMVGVALEAAARTHELATEALREHDKGAYTTLTSDVAERLHAASRQLSAQTGRIAELEEELELTRREAAAATAERAMECHIERREREAAARVAKLQSMELTLKIGELEEVLAASEETNAELQRDAAALFAEFEAEQKDLKSAMLEQEGRRLGDAEREAQALRRGRAQGPDDAYWRLNPKARPRDRDLRPPKLAGKGKAALQLPGEAQQLPKGRSQTGQGFKQSIAGSKSKGQSRPSLQLRMQDSRPTQKSVAAKKGGVASSKERAATTQRMLGTF